MITGKVLSVETRNLGEPAVATAAIAATTLYVNDASTFDETGGIISVGGDLLTYLTTDVEADTLTLATGLVTAVGDQVLVEVYPPTPVKTALVDIGDEGGDVVPATVPQSLLDKLPDGVRDDSNAVSVTLEQRGIYELVISDILGEPLTQQSLDFIEGEEGYGLDQSVAQMRDAQVIGQLGAAAVSAETITLGGLDLQTQINQAPVGKLLSAKLAQQASAIAITTTATKIFELNCGTVAAGRTYRVAADLLLTCSGTLAFTDRIYFAFHYTLDGSTPTTASPTMQGGFHDNSFTPGGFVTARPEAELDIETESTLRVGVVVDLLSGAGSYSIYATTSAQSRPVLSLYDDGPSGARNDAAITLTGGGTTRFVKTFNPTWAYASMNGNLTTNPAYSDIGNSATWGYGMLGAFGFNSADIVSKLAGSVTPVSCVLKWRPRTRATAGGLDVRFLSHNYSSASTFETAWFPQQWDDISGPGDLTSLTTFGNAAPGTTYSQSLGTTLFSQFRSGTRKGLAITNSLTPTYNSHPDGSGTFYSFGTYQPQLVFTYDGTS